MTGEISIREFSSQRDTFAAEELERRCEIGSSSCSLVVDMMGDPIARVRNSPLYTMLVAEMDNELVGVVRGSIRTVVMCNHSPANLAKVGYVLGLRVSPAHRRKGVGYELITSLENWFSSNGAQYAYMATEKDNLASVKLFTERCHYSKFRTPSILVNPVSFHSRTIPSGVKIVKLSTNQAESLYRTKMGQIEFFPNDIDQILANKLCLGTWVSYLKDDNWDKINNPPESWAVLSVWNSSEVFKLKVEGGRTGGIALGARLCRVLIKAFPCLGLPSFPDVFNSFGLYFIYGLSGSGPKCGLLVKALCNFVSNMAAKSRDCRVIVTEVGGRDKLRGCIPHWKRLSCEDLWCIKSLGGDHYRTCCAREGLPCWPKTPPPESVFVDPREV